MRSDFINLVVFLFFLAVGKISVGQMTLLQMQDLRG